jgi:DNA-directed RNA polymerase subunit alpha
LDLSVRAYNCLKRSGLTTVGAVLEKSEEELLSLRNFGDKSYEELRDKLVANGFPAPRVDTRRSPAAEEAPEATATRRGGAIEDDEEGVSALGAALMEALRESGSDGRD